MLIISRARFLALALSLLLALGVSAAAPPLRAHAADAAPSTIDSGSLEWGIKGSWRAYVGSAGTSFVDGAVASPQGTYSFPVEAGTFDSDTVATNIQFRGSVRFQAYCTDDDCLLDTTYGNLRIVISSDEQTLYGDWAGNSREDGSRGSATNVPLATLDISDATVAIDGGTTTWSGVRAVATDRFETYDEGTLLDEVSFSYVGDGAKPDLLETWDVPGAPRFEATTDGWYSQSTSAADRSLRINDAGTVAHVVQQGREGSARIVTLRALDAHDLRPLGDPITLTNYNNFRETPIAFDPARDDAYWVDGDLRLMRSSWDEQSEEYTTTNIGELPRVISGVTQVVYSLVWNSDGDELAVLTGPANRSDAVLHVFHPASAGANAVESFAIPRPSAYDPAFSTVSSFTSLFGGPQSFEAEVSLLPVSKDSYLYTGSGWTTVNGVVTAVPVVQLSIDDGALSARSVVGAAPDGTTGTRGGYAGIAALSDDRFIAYERAGQMQYLALRDGEVEVDGGRVILQLPGTEAVGINGRPVVDPGTGLLVGYNSAVSSLVVFDGDTVVELTPVADARASATRSFPLVQNPDGSLYVQHRGADGFDGFQKWERVGSVPTVEANPASVTIDLLEGVGSVPVTFSAGARAEPLSDVQWQIRPAGSTTFVDIDGADRESYSFDARSTHDGSEYRAVFTNAAGSVASTSASLAVRTWPSIEVQPIDVSVLAGQRASFSVLPGGNPAPVVLWQHDVDGVWADIATDSDDYSFDGTSLILPNATASADGRRIRAVVSNAVGTAYSDEVTLSVKSPIQPEQPTTFTGVAFDWTGSPEWQKRPPNGSTANYLSAGVSDGTQATYAAASDGVEIVQRDGAGAEATATWDTRGAHVELGGSATQAVRLTDGTAVVQPDGSATISWPASFSVNFYDGLVPFTLTDLELVVGTDGSGTLTADLSGYEGDMADPTKPKEAVDTVAGVTVATFRNVVVDTEDGFTVTPDFAGVEISTPDGATAQVRTGSGWGAWPQGFVDFHQSTGLAAYFYTTGGTMDVYKTPNAFAVGFDGATPVVPPTVEPEEPEEPVQPEPGAEPTPAAAPTPNAAGVVEGSLVWGVKQSFRNYIAGPIAKGSISVSSGATTQNGAFWFGQSATDWSEASAVGSTTYVGAVTFRGHSGVLNLTMSDPIVRIDSATSGTLLVRVNGGAHTALGALDLGAATRAAASGGVAYSNVPVTLTGAGASVFSYGSSQFYPAGTAMDPLSFVVGTTATAAPSGGATGAVASYSSASWTAPATAPANTGLYISPEQLADLRPGSEVTVTGSGFDPNEADIKVVLYSDPIVLEESLAADAAGTATWAGLIPLDLEPGVHTLTFQGSQNLGIDITVREAEALTGCVVTSSELTWGFKESFRSYISGSIAHGEWTLQDGTTYEVPNFGWTGADGVFDSEEFTGRIPFTGSILFTGHDGLLTTTVGNPTLVFTGPDTAYLLLDVSGVTMDDAMAGNTDNALTFTQVTFAELDLTAGTIDLSEDGTTITAIDVPATITAEGHEAFPNYEAGTAFDPVSFTVTTDAACAIVTEDEAEPEALAVVDAPDAANSDGSWILWAGGGLLAAGAIAALAIWIVRRRRQGADAETSVDARDSSPNGS